VTRYAINYTITVQYH